jgi:hypothetical protein
MAEPSVSLQSGNRHAEKAARKPDRTVVGVPLLFGTVCRMSAFATSVRHGFLPFLKVTSFSSLHLSKRIRKRFVTRFPEKNLKTSSEPAPSIEGVRNNAGRASFPVLPESSISLYLANWQCVTGGRDLRYPYARDLPESDGQSRTDRSPSPSTSRRKRARRL